MRYFFIILLLIFFILIVPCSCDNNINHDEQGTISSGNDIVWHEKINDWQIRYKYENENSMKGKIIK